MKFVSRISNLKTISMLIWMLLHTVAYGAEVQPITGAGTSIALASLFFEHFPDTLDEDDYKFPVSIHSIKHAGGIKASDKYLFGRTGRPLNEEEKAMGKEEILLASIPLAIVVGDGVRVRSITIHQLSDVITGKIKNWKILGGPNQAIILAGREPTEAAFTVLKKDYPFFNKAQFNHVFTRDHQIMKIISSSGGKYTLSFGARNNFDEKNILHVEGFKSGVKAGLVYDKKNKNHPLVNAVKKYARGREWRKLLTDNGFYPIHQ